MEAIIAGRAITFNNTVKAKYRPMADIAPKINEWIKPLCPKNWGIIEYNNVRKAKSTLSVKKK